MDEKRAIEHGYGRRSPLPLYRKKYDSSFSPRSDISRLRSRHVAYITAIILALILLTYASAFQQFIIPGTSSVEHCFSVFPVSAHFNAYLHCYSEPIQTQSIHAKSNQTELVPLEAHVMSKCPDAKTCLEELVVPAMEQVVDIVDFRLSYIGSVDENDTLRTYHLEIKS